MLLTEEKNDKKDYQDLQVLYATTVMIPIYPSSLRFKFRCYVISLRCMLDIGYNAFF